MKKYKIGCAIVNKEGYSFVEIVRNDAILNFLADDMNCISRLNLFFYTFVILKSSIVNVQHLWRLIFNFVLHFIHNAVLQSVLFYHQNFVITFHLYINCLMFLGKESVRKKVFEIENNIE